MLIIVRIVVLSLLLAGTIIFGILPTCIRPYLNSCQCSEYHHKKCATRKQRLATCFLIFFGGGVLLSTCLVRLLHEVHEEYDDYLQNCFTAGIENASVVVQNDVAINENDEKEIINTVNVSTESFSIIPWNDNRRYSEVNGSRDSGALCEYLNKTPFPFPEFITACGFFLIYFVEELIKSVIRCYQALVINSLDTSTLENGYNFKKEPLTLQKIRKISLTDLENTPASSIIELPVKKNETVAKNMFLKYSQRSLKHLGIEEIKKSVRNLNFFYGESDMRELNIKGLDDFITILALSFNSVFEGFAAGFQHTEISTWMLFFSIALHKYVSVFVISLEILNKGGRSIRVMSYIAMFSLMSPIGMLAAILTHHNLVETGNFEILVLNSLSVGTLLYVTFYEMLKQRNDYVEISGFAQFFVLLTGFIVMSIIEYFYTRVE